MVKLLALLNTRARETALVEKDGRLQK